MMYRCYVFPKDDEGINPFTGDTHSVWTAWFARIPGVGDEIVLEWADPECPLKVSGVSLFAVLDSQMPGGEFASNFDPNTDCVADIEVVFETEEQKEWWRRNTAE